MTEISLFDDLEVEYDDPSIPSNFTHDWFVADDGQICFFDNLDSEI